LFLIAMATAGAAEQMIIQWSSSMIELGIHLPKLTGDLLGPCLFAALMGFGRIMHSIKLHKYPIMNLLLICSVLCLMFYLFISFSSTPYVVLISCGLCGISVSIMWPGMLSYCASEIPTGGTAMFGMLAISGNIGCILSSLLMGILGERFGLQASIARLLFFPASLFVVMIILRLSVHHEIAVCNDNE